jgi:hypothetical protein
VISRELTDIPHKFYGTWLDPDHEARRVATCVQVRGKRIKCYAEDGAVVADLELSGSSCTEAEIVASLRACEISGVDLSHVQVQAGGAACAMQ